MIKGYFNSKDGAPFFRRDLSWLSFNSRVLQEAGNAENPLFERMKFLAIFSSNLDEFFRVRVALYQQLSRMEKSGKISGFSPVQLLEKIRDEVIRQQDRFGNIFEKEILPALEKENIRLINHTQLSPKQKEFVRKSISAEVLKYSRPIPIGNGKPTPFLDDKGLYYFLRATDKEKPRIERYFFLSIPSKQMGRFVELPRFRGYRSIMILDELVRFLFPVIFPNDLVRSSFEVKMSRDAELYLEDEEGSSILEKVIRSLPKRHTGSPSRLLYDGGISKAHLKIIRDALDLKKSEMIPGGVVHNFNDLFSFPIGSKRKYSNPPQPPHIPKPFKKRSRLIDLVGRNPLMLHFPYQSYQPVVDLLMQAAKDPHVTSIQITLYRVSKDSGVCKALEIAAKQGKEVLVFNEIKARFDEESNIFWGDRLNKAGAKVLYSFDDLKVHSKIFLIKRKKGRHLSTISYLGTGNFNEKTSEIYCDHALITPDKVVANDLDKVFSFLRTRKDPGKFKEIFVSPLTLRKEFSKLIDHEINEASGGRKASMILKMNSLEDKEMISKLYQASMAGVKIKIIVRGICCLVPGDAKWSKNIKVYSLVDRYLEHARIFQFHHGGKEKMYLASADWMHRNLSKRVEVGFPITDPDHRLQLKTLLDLQLKDNTHQRIINKTQSNPFNKGGSTKPIRAQKEFFEFLRAY